MLDYSSPYYRQIMARIRNAQSIRELDRVATEFYSCVEARQSTFRWDVDMAIDQKEEELRAVSYDLVRKPVEPPLVFELTRRKTPVLSPPKKEEEKPVLLEQVQCGCIIKENIPCIHKLTFNNLLPEDYQECEICGCDHRYDPRLANEVHSKL